MKSPMDTLLNKVDWKCTICGKSPQVCDCWTKCYCGWSYEKGRSCRNPKHESTKGENDGMD